MSCTCWWFFSWLCCPKVAKLYIYRRGFLFIKWSICCPVSHTARCRCFLNTLYIHPTFRIVLLHVKYRHMRHWLNVKCIDVCQLLHNVGGGGVLFLCGIDRDALFLKNGYTESHWWNLILRDFKSSSIIFNSKYD